MRLATPTYIVSHIAAKHISEWFAVRASLIERVRAICGGATVGGVLMLRLRRKGDISSDCSKLYSGVLLLHHLRH